MCWFYYLLAVIGISLTVFLTSWLQFPITITITAVLLLVLLIMHFYRMHLIKKVSRMTFCEKVQNLNNIAEPYGFLYQYPEDIFSSTVDAWQRTFGYTRLFDNMAPIFGMIFDSEPVYFNYQGKTWLIQFWKGQYGINTGAEVGIYHADGIIAQKKRTKIVFDSVENSEMLKITYRLLEKKRTIFSVSGKHWWLTGFSMGRFSRPENLQMVVCITFPDLAMRNAFIEGLIELGYDTCDLEMYCLSLSFSFSSPKSRQPDFVKTRRISLVQMRNQFLCRMFLLVTRPFDNTLDRLTFLRLNLPFIFKRTISMRKISKRYKKSRRLC